MVKKLSKEVVVITPPLPRDGGTARTEIQVHAVNLIKIRLIKGSCSKDLILQKHSMRQ